MIKITCDNLEEVYQEASKKLDCSVTQIQFDIVQYPRNIFGIIKRKAIVIAYKKDSQNSSIIDTTAKMDANEYKDEKIIDIDQTKQDNEKDKKVDDFSAIEDKNTNAILDTFYGQNNQEVKNKKESVDKSEKEIIAEISSTIKDVFCLECLNCHCDEISFYNEKTIYIKFVGEDSPLLIGKNGYRYKALSYLIFSWIFSKYNLFVKIEVGDFLFNQGEMIKKHLRNFIQEVERFGYGDTDPLDGVLLHLGVEHLREMFPNKMVVIKTNKNEDRYIKVCDFKR